MTLVYWFWMQHLHLRRIAGFTHDFNTAECDRSPELLGPHQALTPNNKAPTMREATLYSRANQSNIVWTILGKKQGFFVEMTNGKNSSSTLALEELYDWTGLLVESNNASCSRIDDLMRHAWRFCGCVDVDGGAGKEEKGYFSSKVFAEINVRHVDYFSVDAGGNELVFLESLRSQLANKDLTVDVWSVPYRHSLSSEPSSLEKLNAMRGFFGNLGYQEWGFLGRDSANLVPADANGTEVVFVKSSLMHRISVVVPAIFDNVETGELQLLIQTLDQSSMQPYEVVVVLTGITDANCADTANEVANPNRSYILRLACFPAQVMQAVARNRGIDLARGEWVSFIDADDPMHPAKLELMSKYIRENPDLKLFLHGYLMPDTPNKTNWDGNAIFDRENSTRGWKPHIIIDLMNSQSSARRDISKEVRFREGNESFRLEDSYFVRDVIKKVGRVGPAMLYYPHPLANYLLRTRKQALLAKVREERNKRKQQATSPVKLGN